MKRPLSLFFGGSSDEHAVSLHSAAYLLARIRALDHPCYPIVIDRDGAWYHYRGRAEDILTAWRHAAAPITLSLGEGASPVFLEEGEPPFTPQRALSCLHGGGGENGDMQGLFRTLGIPFIGCDVLSSAITADKDMAKTIVSHHGIATAPWRTVRRGDEIPTGLRAPLFVKPIDGGSSIGASLVANIANLPAAVTAALSHSSAALIEDCIRGTEIEIGIIERADGQLLISPPGEIAVQNGFYDYQTKYTEGGIDTFLPARLTKEETRAVRRTAEQIFRLLRCRHFCRIDFFRATDGTLYFNEVNTLPGFTAHSMFPRLFAHIGIDAVEELLAL